MNNQFAFNKISCVIIEGHTLLLKTLAQKLSKDFPEIDLKGMANSGLSGFKKIIKYKPQLVFLNTELPDMTGFEMLNKLNRTEFETIFISSSSIHAIQAIRYNALDFLIPPFEFQELNSAINRFKERCQENMSTKAELGSGMKIEQNTLDILSLRTQKGIVNLRIRDILFLKAENNYTSVYLSSGKKELFSKTIKDFENLLSDKGFFRCHKSYLVNLKFRDSKFSNRYFQLSSGDQIPVSRRKYPSLKVWVMSNNENECYY
ncbi:LytTR family DNA-binding domain-containing protein [Pontixanthobacter gangjinensis]|uniref:Response regulator transcription factor n=1 Tax=Christiangramia aestuarii TaxID=1028746 RepID=A0A7K1LNB9_9FLAO|nr:LytTR family DNA-binding domain-containing protein [Christiangramia aestuarii]MUP42299.1 response regulator transcription factor [Christiangramia aestuarii]